MELGIRKPFYQFSSFQLIFLTKFCSIRTDVEKEKIVLKQIKPISKLSSESFLLTIFKLI